MIRVMLSLDLADAESERDNFNAFLGEQQWKKLADVNTVWALEYEALSQSSEEDVRNLKGHISRVLLAAAEQFKPSSITYVAQIGNLEVIGRVIRKKDSEYKLFEYSPC